MDGRRLRIDQPHKSFERSLEEFERLLKYAASTAPVFLAHPEQSNLDQVVTSTAISPSSIHDLMNSDLAVLDAFRRKDLLESLYRP